MTASDRRKEALRLRAEGLSLREIARRLSVSLAQIQRDTARVSEGDTEGGTPAVPGTAERGKNRPIPGKQPSDASKPMRDRLKDDLESRYDGLLKLLDDGMQATRKVRIQRACPKCGCDHVDYVEIQDFKTARDIAEFFANQGFGRPGVSEGETAAAVWNFENRIFLITEDDEMVGELPNQRTKE
jgi:hypothetical protein